MSIPDNKRRIGEKLALSNTTGRGPSGGHITRGCPPPQTPTKNWETLITIVSEYINNRHFSSTGGRSSEDIFDIMVASKCKDCRNWVSSARSWPTNGAFLNGKSGAMRVAVGGIGDVTNVCSIRLPE